MNNFDLISAYQKAITFCKTHYENFPVISFLIKKKLQKDIAIIYWFARTADDIADEGNDTSEQKIKKLNDFELSFNNLLNGNCSSEFDFALSNTINSLKLTPNNFLNLLKAFKQDVSKNRYDDFNELLDYCNNSANPVGRLVLEVNNIRDEKAFVLSDKICTALQLTNFYQDVLLDFKKGRIYIPQSELKKFNVTEKKFELKIADENFSKMIESNLIKIKELFYEGRELLKYLNGFLKIEIAWTILGGLEILKKIQKNNFDVLNNRPNLKKKDFFILLLKSFLYARFKHKRNFKRK